MRGNSVWADNKKLAAAIESLRSQVGEAKWSIEYRDGKPVVRRWVEKKYNK